jgi:bla regulator protein blaR1
MAGWSQSHFLQSLGWATLNSFWQMALLWCLFLAMNSLLRLGAHRRYQLAVGAVITGFVWFTISFFIFFLGQTPALFPALNHGFEKSASLLNSILLSASVTYLALLIFPSYKLVRNWQFVNRIKKEGLGKADLGYRLFVQKVAGHLGIGKKVMVYVSRIVTSPVTVGYLKPIILLPVAVMNHLTTQQVEAILLHELSHIRRYDYLVNFIISIITTLLYFNPFVKQFLKIIEAERETCCDDLVLQFGYDKVSYASALLTLEKASAVTPVLAIGATGKSNLLKRIEKIVGMEKKKKFSFTQFAAVLAALICILAFNSFLLIKEEKKANYSFAYNNFANPFMVFSSEDASSPVHSITPVPAASFTQNLAVAEHPAQQRSKSVHPATASETFGLHEWQEQPTSDHRLVQVAADDVDMQLTTEEKDQVQKTVTATKKVVSNLQWKEIETAIGDVMNKQEKALTKQLYMKQMESTVNWENVEKNLKANYENIDLNTINTKLNNALVSIQLDSIQKCYTAIYNSLEKAEAQAKAKAKVSVSPMPDASLEDISHAKEKVAKEIETIKTHRTRKVVRL